MSSTKVFLIRHAKTLWNQKGILQGSLDSPLTKLGIQQAMDLARRIEWKNIETCYQVFNSEQLLRAN